MPRIKCIVVFLFCTLLGSSLHAEDVEVLIVLSEAYGGNTFLNIDDFQRHGWHLTTTAVTQTVSSCPNFEARSMVVDTLFSEISSIAHYDVLAIMPASTQALGSSVYSDILNDPWAMHLITSAVDSGLVLYTICAGPRILAAADRLNGVSIVGARGPGDLFVDEYTNAGAVYLGDDHPPVIHENIVTGVRDLHYHVQNTEAVATVLEKTCDRIFSSDRKRTLSMKAYTPDRGNENILWSYTFGGESGDGATAICATEDGGAVLCGFTYSIGEGNSDLLILKVNSEGEEQWSVPVGGDGFEYGHAIRAVSNGGYIVTGSTTSFGSGQKDIYLVRLDANGKVAWQRSYGGPDADDGRDVCETADGGFVICGYTESFSAGEDDFYMIKTDESGDTLWTRTFGSTRSETGQSVCETEDGGLLFFGSAGSPDLIEANRDYYLVKMDRDGSVIWHTNHNGAYFFSYDWGTAVCPSRDGRFLLVGDGSVNWPMDAFVVTINENGELVRERYFGDTFFDFGTDVIQTNEGGNLICGVYKDFDTTRNDIRLTKLSINGDVIWTEILGDSLGSEWGNAICQMSDGNYLVTGQLNPNLSEDCDVFVMKIANPLFPLFTAEPRSGHAPLAVAFQDQSAGNITSWEWDFDYDGIVDSYEQNPLWEYESAGYQSVSLRVFDPVENRESVIDEYIRVFDGESALFYDGTTSHVTCDASPELNLVDEVTVEAWIMPYGWGEGSGGLRMGEIVDKNRFAVMLIGAHPSFTNNCLCCKVYQEGGPPSLSFTPENSIQIGSWYHIAVSYMSSSGLSIYINGIPQPLDQPTPPTLPIVDNTEHNLIIGNSPVHNATFDGIIDEVRIWNIVRSGEEIDSARLDTISGAEPGLVGYWRFNEGAGGSVTDQSIFDNQAVLFGVQWVQGTPFVPTVPIDEPGIEPIPLRFDFHSSGPNPFDSSTSFSYEIPEKRYVIMEIYDILGRRIRTLVDELQISGCYWRTWDGTNNAGNMMANGIYFCRLKAGEDIQTARCILMR